MFRGSVKSTGYLLHPPVSPSLHLPCVTVFHHVSIGVCFTSCMQYNNIYCTLIHFSSQGIILTPYVTFRCSILYPKRMTVLAVIAGLVISLPIILHLWFVPYTFTNIFSRTALIRINLDGEPSGCAENPDNRISLKIGCIGSLEFGCY